MPLTVTPRPRTFGRRIPAPRAPKPPAPTPAPALDVHHLLRRTTYGATPALLAEAARNPAAWLEQQLAPQSIDDSACDAVVARFVDYRLDPPQLYATKEVGSWDGMTATVRATFARALFSRRQLLEVMVEFWSNHLNTTAPSSEVWAGKGFDDRQVIRPHALGRFSDMLQASAKSPAMLHYLDGANSKGSQPNENYGRELLELHTVGRDAGYSQAMVVDAARALTGLTTWNPWNGGTAATNGTFRWRADWHHVGPLKVLDWSHANPERTPAAAESLLAYLAAHPATARRIARKLAVRFVSDDPPAALVDRLASVYLANGTAMTPVLRALFASPEFAASKGGKQRRPYEDVVASCRALGVTPSANLETEAFGNLCWELQELGQAPFGWHPPDGYPDVAAAWSGTGTTLGRWNLHMGLVGAWWKDGGLEFPDPWVTVLPSPRPATREGLVDATIARLLPDSAVPAAHRTALVAFLGGPGPVRDWDHHLYRVVVKLLLDSPHWSVR